MCYKNGWVTIDMVKQAVAKGLLTADEFQQITGQTYTS
ncbi:MAG: XkdX family protein [Desulfurella sp.]